MQYDNKLLIQSVIRLQTETFITLSRNVQHEKDKMHELMFSAASVLQKKS